LADYSLRRNDTLNEFDELLAYSPSADLLQDRVILITGAAGALGAAAAVACAEHGAKLVLLDKNEHGLESLHDGIAETAAHAPVIAVQDLRHATPDCFDTLAKEIDQEWARLDGIVHCAAQLGVLSPLDASQFELWPEVLQVNLLAPYLLTRSCLPLLRRATDASVIFTSSDVARSGRAYWGAYGVSGAALENLVAIWNDELETNTQIRFNSFDPGPVNSPLRDNAYPGEHRRYRRDAAELAPAYLYLLGPESRALRGLQLSAPQRL